MLGREIFITFNTERARAVRLQFSITLYSTAFPNGHTDQRHCPQTGFNSSLAILDIRAFWRSCSFPYLLTVSQTRYDTIVHCVSKKGPTLKRYRSKLYGSILMIFGRNIQKSLEQSLHVSVFMQVCLLSRYRLPNCIPNITHACCALQSAVERVFSCST